MDHIFKQLKAPFSLDEIQFRVGSTNSAKDKGIALAYVDARTVQDRLDQVFGFNWKSEMIETQKGRIICNLSVKIADEWITRSDGAGDTAYEGDKGAISDALKRAAVNFGVARYLYGLGNSWVKIVPAGKSFKIDKEEYGKLFKTLPVTATEKEQEMILKAAKLKLGDDWEARLTNAIMLYSNGEADKVTDPTFTNIVAERLLKVFDKMN